MADEERGVKGMARRTGDLLGDAGSFRRCREGAAAAQGSDCRGTPRSAILFTMAMSFEEFRTSLTSADPVSYTHLTLPTIYSV